MAAPTGTQLWSPGPEDERRFVRDFGAIDVVAKALATHLSHLRLSGLSIITHKDIRNAIYAFLGGAQEDGEASAAREEWYRQLEPAESAMVDRIDWADPLLYAPRLFYGGQNDELRITAWDEIVKREDMPVPFGPLAIWLQIRFKSGLVGSKIVMLLWEADEEVTAAVKLCHDRIRERILIDPTNEENIKSCAEGVVPAQSVTLEIQTLYIGAFNGPSNDSMLEPIKQGSPGAIVTPLLIASLTIGDAHYTIALGEPCRLTERRFVPLSTNECVIIPRMRSIKHYSLWVLSSYLARPIKSVLNMYRDPSVPLKKFEAARGRAQEVDAGVKHVFEDIIGLSTEETAYFVLQPPTVKGSADLQGLIDNIIARTVRDRMNLNLPNMRTRYRLQTQRYGGFTAEDLASRREEVLSRFKRRGLNDPWEDELDTNALILARDTLAAIYGVSSHEISTLFHGEHPFPRQLVIPDVGTFKRESKDPRGRTLRAVFMFFSGRSHPWEQTKGWGGVWSQKIADRLAKLPGPVTRKKITWLRDEDVYAAADVLNNLTREEPFRSMGIRPDDWLAWMRLTAVGSGLDRASSDAVRHAVRAIEAGLNGRGTIFQPKPWLNLLVEKLQGRKNLAATGKGTVQDKFLGELEIYSCAMVLYISGQEPHRSNVDAAPYLDRTASWVTKKLNYARNTPAITTTFKMYWPIIAETYDRIAEMAEAEGPVFMGEDAPPEIIQRAYEQGVINRTQ